MAGGLRLPSRHTTLCQPVIAADEDIKALHLAKYRRLRCGLISRMAGAADGSGVRYSDYGDGSAARRWLIGST